MQGIRSDVNKLILNVPSNPFRCISALVTQNSCSTLLYIVLSTLPKPFGSFMTASVEVYDKGDLSFNYGHMGKGRPQ